MCAQRYTTMPKTDVCAQRYTTMPKTDDHLVNTRMSKYYRTVLSYRRLIVLYLMFKA